MYINWTKKLGSLLLAAVIALGTLSSVPVAAAASNIEVILENVTTDNPSTLEGEAKIKVSVKGAGGKVTAVQTALAFDGDLKYKSIEFLQGTNNPPECCWIAPNAALANLNGKMLPGIVTNNSGALAFSDEKTELFVITFAGEPGKNVNVRLNTDSTAGSSCAVNGTFVATADEAEASVQAVASDTDKKGVNAVVKVVMDVVDDFTVSDGVGYADSKITLTITNENTLSTISTVLNTVSDTNGGHYDSNSSIPTFVVENTVIAGDTYTVEISGGGYATYKAEGVTFDQPLIVKNDEFIPGDINSDGMVDSADKDAYIAIRNGNTDDYDITLADVNRDGKVDDADDVFAGISSSEKTAPAKMSKPTLTAGDGELGINWTAPADGGAAITGYNIKYGTSSLSLNGTAEITNPSATSHTLTGLTPGTTYYVQIAAKNEIGIGEYSDIASAIPLRQQSGGNLGGGGGGGGATGGAVPETTPIIAPTPGTNTSDTFTDLGNYAWAKDAIYQLKDKGIISGVSATQYAPANNIKRGDFILILARMLSLDSAATDSFADVPAGSYYYNAIASAKAAGIAQGSGNNFMPENTITRQDLITLAYRAFLSSGYITESDDLSAIEAFADKDSIDDYAKTAMASMVKAGIIKGSGGKVNPKGNATRAEVAVMCSRLVALIK